MRCNAYADESGNSGLKLFGDQQDRFWMGTLFSFADVDRKYTGMHSELLGLVGKPELPGNELGLGRIEKIAGRLAWFIREKKLRLSFIRVHKPYLAATKLFDLAFDSGANPAVPPLAYGVRHLRLINLLHFAQLLAFDDLKEFWNLFQAQDPNRFGQLLASIRDRVSRAPYDQRSVQVLTESLDWASRHPDAVLDPFGEGDAPNFVAFTALFDHLHQFHKQYGHTIGCFVHDEQDQFIPHFIEAFPLLAKFQGKSHPLAMISDIDFELRLRPGSSLVEEQFRPATDRRLLVAHKARARKPQRTAGTVRRALAMPGGAELRERLRLRDAHSGGGGGNGVSCRPRIFS
jgi:hypothetical protein